MIQRFLALIPIQLLFLVTNQRGQNPNQNLTNQTSQSFKTNAIVEQAIKDWKVETNTAQCLTNQIFLVTRDFIELDQFDNWTEEWTTPYMAFCDSIQSKPKAQVDDTQGLIGKQKQTNFEKWFWKWYFRLDEIWNINGTDSMSVQKNINLAYLLQITTNNKYKDLQNIGKQFSANQELTWEQWDQFWVNYISEQNQIDWAPIRSNFTLKQNKDVVCPDGYFQNEKRNCLKCPPGCVRCTQPNQCLDCFENFELVSSSQFSYCFMKCFKGQYRMTEYSTSNDLLIKFNQQDSKTNPKFAIPPRYMLQTCQKCPIGCSDCYTSLNQQNVFCNNCSAGYNLQFNGQCIPNSQNIVNFLQTETSVLHRCDDIFIRVKESNQTQNQEYESLKWSIETRMTQTELIQLKPELQKVLLYFNNKPVIIIPSNITEKMTSGYNLSIKLDSKLNQGFKFNNQTSVLLLPNPEIQLWVSTKRLFLRAQDPVKLHFLHYYYKCNNQLQNFKPVMPDHSNGALICTLLNQNLTKIKDLNNLCQIEQNTLESNKQYFIRVDFILPTNQVQKPQVHYIGLQTETPQTFCSFGTQEVKVAAGVYNLLQVQVYGQKQDAQKYKWSCLLNQTLPCNYNLTNINQFLNIYSIPYTKMNFNVEIQRQLSANRYSTIDSCQITLNVQGVNDVVIPLQIHNQKPSLIGDYYDPSQNYQFSCNSSQQIQSMNLQLLMDNLRGDKISVLQINSSQIFISSGQLSPNRKYYLVCTAFNNQKTGQISKLISTEYYEDDYDFTILADSPTIPYLTSVQFGVVKKSQNKALKCEFGYLNSVGKVQIQDQTNFGQIFSSAQQYVESILPYKDVSEFIQNNQSKNQNRSQNNDSTSRNRNSNQVLTLYCNCFDSVGRQKMKTFNIQLKSDKNDYQQNKNRNLSKLLTNPSPRVSDIIIFAQFQMDYSNNNSLAILMNSIISISQTHNFSSQELKQLGRIYSYALNQTNLNSSLANKIAKSLNSILTQLIDKRISSEDFLTFAQILDKLSSFTLENNYSQILQKLLFSKVGDQYNIPQSYLLKLNSMTIQINQANSTNIQQSGKYAFNTGDLIPTQIQIPNDKRFAQYEKVIFTTIISNQNYTNQSSIIYVQTNESQPNFLAFQISNQVSIEARVQPQNIDQPSQLVAVNNLQEQIQILIPLPNTNLTTDNLQCVYLNTSTNVWQPVPSCLNSTQGYYSCCSNHLTTFSIVQISSVQQNSSSYQQQVLVETSLPLPPVKEKIVQVQTPTILSNMSFQLNENRKDLQLVTIQANQNLNQRSNESILFIVFFVTFAVLLILSVIVEKLNVLIYYNSTNKDDLKNEIYLQTSARELAEKNNLGSLEERETSSKIYQQNEQPSSRDQQEINKNFYETQKPLNGNNQIVEMVILPNQTAIRQNIYNIEKQKNQDDVVSAVQPLGTVTEPSDSDLRESGVSLQQNHEEIKESDIEIVFNEGLKGQEYNQNNEQPESKSELKFCQVYQDVMIFQGRIFSCFIRFNTQSNRPVQVFSLCAQVGIMCALFSIVIYYTQSDAAGLVFTFIAMRLVQQIFQVLEMVKTKKRWIWRIVFILSIPPSYITVWYFCNQNYYGILRVLFLELLLNDFLLIPLIVAIVYKNSSLAREIIPYIRK